MPADDLVQAMLLESAGGLPLRQAGAPGAEMLLEQVEPLLGINLLWAASECGPESSTALGLTDTS
jgi:hypothetical protein